MTSKLSSTLRNSILHMRYARTPTHIVVNRIARTLIAMMAGPLSPASGDAVDDILISCATLLVEPIQELGRGHRFVGEASNIVRIVTNHQRDE